jgi:hypothetical protein
MLALERRIVDGRGGPGPVGASADGRPQNAPAEHPHGEMPRGGASACGSSLRRRGRTECCSRAASLTTRLTRPHDDLRHAIDRVLRETPGATDHRWVAEAPVQADRPWGALEIRLHHTCDAQCAHEIERRLLSIPGVDGLGPHWPRPEHEDRTLVLRLYFGPTR